MPTPKYVTVQYFLDHVLPSLPPHIEVPEIFHKLQDAGTAITMSGRWRGFADDPADSARGMKKSFKYVVEMVNAIARAAAGQPTETVFSFHNNTHCVMNFDSRNTDTLPDAWVSSGESPSWDRIAVCGEYKKFDDPEDVLEVSSSIFSLTWQNKLTIPRNCSERRQGHVQHGKLYARGRPPPFRVRFHDGEHEHETMVLRPSAGVSF